LVSNAASQLEEHIKHIPKNSFFYGLKHNMPFTDMAWGHVEMFSLALIDENSKNILIQMASDILKARFGQFMQDEANRFLDFLFITLNNLENTTAQRSPHIFIWLQKAKKEIDKIRFLKTYDEDRLKDAELMASAAMFKFNKI
jgi:hypothetical protein